MHRRLLSCLAATALWFSCAALAADGSERETEVRQRGTEVMPFSLPDTVHVFEKTDEGGLQRVEARPGHSDQVPMIQQHLKMIAEQFAARDFSAPARIHGEAMPGLAELRDAAATDLEVRFRAMDQGAEVRYVAHTDALRKAIHQWFDAQLADHGHDATGHHHHPGH